MWLRPRGWSRNGAVSKQERMTRRNGITRVLEPTLLEGAAQVGRFKQELGERQDVWC